MANDDNFYLYVDWGDGSVEEWIGPYESGDEVSLNHVWENNNKYTIQVKAKDTNDKESEWVTQSVFISRSRNPTSLLLLSLFEHFINQFQFLKNILRIIK